MEDVRADDAQRPGLIVVLGGARSGKSRYGEELAAQLAGAGRVIYVATATAYDDEMRARIAHHRAERPAAWATIEAPRDPATALRASLGADDGHEPPRAILLDCVTLLAANLLTGEGATADDTPITITDAMSADAIGAEPANDRSPAGYSDDATQADPLVAATSEARVLRAVDDLLAVAREHAIPLIVVTNEVGMGVVPPYPLGRVYRDILGRANALLAAQADVVLLMLAGLPIELKALATAWQERAASGMGASE